MRNIRCADNGYCSLSRGTQSDGLVSDTSTEELTSNSSTENSKEDESFENIIARNSKEIGDDSHNSASSIHVKPYNSLHQPQVKCQSYIRWGVLLSFGISLWIALWITDTFTPNPCLKEDVATAKKVTLQAGMMKQPGLSTWWFFDIWRYRYGSTVSMTVLDIVIFLSCVMILVYLETHVGNKWKGTIGRLCYVEFFKGLYNTRKEKTKTEDNSVYTKILEEVTPEELESKSCGDDLSKFSHGDVKNFSSPDETKVNLELGEGSTRYLNERGRLSFENRVSKSLKCAHNKNNTRTRSRQKNSVENYCNFSCRRNNISQDLVTSELILDEPNFDLNYSFFTSKNDGTKSILEQCNLTCSIFNKSTSCLTEIETWVEPPNSDQAEEVMHSFDMELEDFFNTQSSSTLLSFGERTPALQRFNNTNIGCDCTEPSKAVISNVDYNKGIISSSPAFQRFLVSLAKDRPSESYV